MTPQADVEMVATASRSPTQRWPVGALVPGGSMHGARALNDLQDHEMTRNIVPSSLKEPTVRSPMKLAIGALFGLVSAASAAVPCTIKASGGDDAPALLRALKSCREVWVPKDTTLSIRTALNATGLNNVHLNLAGTIKYYEDLAYWAGHAFPFGE